MPRRRKSGPSAATPGGLCCCCWCDRGVVVGVGWLAETGARWVGWAAYVPQREGRERDERDGGQAGERYVRLQGPVYGSNIDQFAPVSWWVCICVHVRIYARSVGRRTTKLHTHYVTHAPRLVGEPAPAADGGDIGRAAEPDPPQQAHRFGRRRHGCLFVCG